MGLPQKKRRRDIEPFAESRSFLCQMIRATHLIVVEDGCCVVIQLVDQCVFSFRDINARSYKRQNLEKLSLVDFCRTVKKQDHWQLHFLCHENQKLLEVLKGAGHVCRI